MERGRNEGKDDAAGAYHVPVLYRESIDALNIQPAGVYVDCTFGGGGHSRGILERLGPEGRLFAFDQDAAAQANLPDDTRLQFIPENFRHVRRFLRLYGVEQVDGLLADLGVSSHQFDEASRGFSYRYDAALDMRMDRRQPMTAAELLNTMPAAALQDMLSRYGEVTNARTLSQAIVARRQLQPYSTINDLLQTLEPLSKGNPNRYYAQVFQALRMEVNDETGALRELLLQLPQIVKPGGRIAIITFHSVEDRIVKQMLREGPAGNEPDPVTGKRPFNPFELIYKKPLEATPAEIEQNSRARSARLRVATIRTAN